MELLITVQTAGILLNGAILAYVVWRLETEIRAARKTLAEVNKRLVDQRELEKRVAELEARRQ